MVAAAHDEAARIIAAAASEGETAARAGPSAALGPGSSAGARNWCWRSRPALRRELARQVREAAADLRQDASYPTLLATLTQRCRAVPGAEAVVTEDLGRRRGRTGRLLHPDLSLPALAARTLDAMSPQVSRLRTH
ncbi:MAG: hypothetical protein IPO80_07985 [Propionibacteriaceae bacterium]|nr:hypothetical protein [Propionibacteriaceae bacterium]